MFYLKDLPQTFLETEGLANFYFCLIYCASTMKIPVTMAHADSPLVIVGPPTIKLYITVIDF